MEVGQRGVGKRRENQVQGRTAAPQRLSLASSLSNLCIRTPPLEREKRDGGGGLTDFTLPSFISPPQRAPVPSP